MADDLLLTLGDVRRIAHEVSADETFTVASGTVTIFNEAGTETVSDAAVSGDPVLGTSATAHELHYAWTPAAAGQYRYVLRYVVGGETLSLRGSALVWPEASLLDRYLQRIQDLAQDTEAGEDQRILSLRDYRNVLEQAVRAYSEARPREVTIDVTLDASDWTYPLSGLATGVTPAAAWANGFSEILSIEYPRDTTEQNWPLVYPLGWSVDEQASTPEWRLNNISPAAAEIARVRWKTTHTLSHTVDTTPTRDFEAICLFAAGLALAVPAANQAAHTNDPQIAAAVVSFRDIQQRRRQQGMDMQVDARRLWKRREFFV